MKTREIDKEQDLDEIERWYKDHGWDALVPRELLPTRGYMVDDHAALWLYIDDAKTIGWLAHIVTNPRKNRALAFKALHMIYERAEEEAKALEVRCLTQTVRHSSLKKLAEQHNYLAGDIELSNYWKKI